MKKNILKEANILIIVMLMVLSTSTVMINSEKAESNLPFNDPVLELRFYQMDFNFDGTVYENTDWGSVDLLYVGQDPIMYFNLAVNGEWQIQNIPVLSAQGVDVDQYMTYYFDLGNEVGDEVNSVTYGYDFTEDVLQSKPDEFYTAPVTERIDILYDGEKGGVKAELAKAKAIVGSRVSSTKKHAHKDFPNQECNKSECAPAAISNSLKFLNEKYNLGLTDEQTSIAKMKNATDWKNGAPANWWEIKKKYMEDKNYPITTRKITDMDKLIEEMDAGQDIEIRETWKNKTGHTRGHVTCLIGITKLEDGNYSLDVADDRKQGEDGGTNNPRTYTYNPKTGNFTEPGFGDTKFEWGVVECPKLPKWSYHFKFPSCPGGTLKVYGTHDCVRIEPPLFDRYAERCTKYQGYIPEKISGKEVNDVIFDFDWDYWCNNEDHIKFVSPKWDGELEKWVLTSIPSWIETNINEEFKLPTIGDALGEIQNIYVIVNLDEALANPVPPQDEYFIYYGECEDLPGYLIGTTPIVFNPYSGPDIYPFETTPLDNYELVNDGEITFSPVANQAPYAPDIYGPSSGEPGVNYEFTVVTTDPEDDNVYYEIDWGDGNIESTGFYLSGEEVTVTHTWPSQGTFITKAKAEDVYGEESDWAEFIVVMPRAKVIQNTMFQWFLEKFPILHWLFQRFILL